MQLRTDLHPESALSVDPRRAAIQDLYLKVNLEATEDSRIYATDGAIGVELPVECNERDQDGIVTRVTIEELRKHTPKNAFVTLEATANNKTVEFKDEDKKMDLSVERPDVSYPIDALRKMIDDAKKLAGGACHYQIAFDLNKLVQLSRALGSEHSVILSFPDSQASVIAVSPNLSMRGSGRNRYQAPASVEDAIGILMPIRTDYEERTKAFREESVTEERTPDSVNKIILDGLTSTNGALEAPPRIENERCHHYDYQRVNRLTGKTETIRVASVALLTLFEEELKAQTETTEEENSQDENINP